MTGLTGRCRINHIAIQKGGSSATQPGGPEPLPRKNLFGSNLETRFVSKIATLAAVEFRSTGQPEGYSYSNIYSKGISWPVNLELYATFETTEGNIVCRLFDKDAPKTVANFVELAEGKREWTHPNTRKKSKDRLYDGTIFHRVIPDFMIQGGDPQGTGMGGPGYQFEDETKGSPHKFDKPGKLAMANAGPNTNG